jgi:integrase
VRFSRRKVASFGQWVDEYMAGVRLRKKRPQHDAGYLAVARKEWEHEPVDMITTENVDKLITKYRETLKAHYLSARRRGPARSDGSDEIASSPNRLLASIRACFQSAWRLGVVPSNPAARVVKLREGTPRSRVLSDEELHGLLVALESWPQEHERAAFLLLVQTGARLSEVLHAKWSDVDLDAGEWTIPSPKAGHKQIVPLPKGTVAMLRRLKRVGSLVIPGCSNPDKPRYDLKEPWKRLREEAGLGGDVHVHDLRRTYGLRIARAAGLHVASKLLRHGDVRITEKVYVPLGLDDLRPATEAHAGQLGKVLKMRPKKKAI